MIKECIVCNKKFDSDRNAQKCCSVECRKIRKKYTDKEKVKNKNLTCNNCGKEFIGNKNNKFCSKECRSKYKKENLRMYKHTCLVCKKEYESKNKYSKYCSYKCNYKHKIINPKHTLICEKCKKEFKSNNKKQKFCSESCIKQYMQDKRIKFICKNCGEEFFKKPQSNCKNLFCTPKCSFEYRRKSNIKYCLTCNSELKDRNRKYCSEECKIKHKTKEYICHHCNNKFNSTREKKYCSKECQLEAGRINMRKRLKNKFISEIKECKYCGKHFATEYKKSKTYCSDECKRKMNNLLSKLHDGKRAERIQRNGEIHNDITLKKLYKKHNGLCSICGEKCDYEDYSISKEGYFIANSNYPSIDHIIPIAKGGTHTWNNVQLAHRICNSIKNDNCKEVI